MVHLFHRSKNLTKPPEPKHMLEQTLPAVPEKPTQEPQQDHDPAASPSRPVHDPATSPSRLIHDATRVSNPTNMLGSMPASEEDIAPFPVPEISSMPLDNKHGAKVNYTYYPASAAPKLSATNPFAQTLIVFLNGLILPRSSWDPAITAFLQTRIRTALPYPALLTYDRLGQAGSDRDPNDTPAHDHDLLSAVRDLRQLTAQIWSTHAPHSAPAPCLVFVGNSIGCALARLFAQTYPGTVIGLLFLDSILAASDSSSIWPDPDAEGFDPHSLPAGVSADDVRSARHNYALRFDPSVRNDEGLSRLNLAALLPFASSPVLEGWGGTAPYLTVAGHDWETFAEHCSQPPLSIPPILTMTYLNPLWTRYNTALTQLTPEKAIGPLIALNCGHFIQRDGPRWVAEEVVSLLDRVVNGVEQVSERTPEIRREMVRSSTEYGVGRGRGDYDYGGEI